MSVADDAILGGVVVRALAITEKIEPLLAGQGEAVQAAVLAQLTATWASGHHPASTRVPFLRAHYDAVISMVEAMEKDGMEDFDGFVFIPGTEIGGRVYEGMPCLVCGKPVEPGTGAPAMPPLPALHTECMKSIPRPDEN